jgi:prepilin-type N-terminal cleavage/methylation domain-containing protein/prepilin-type processing-associated H-X9-DG protein
MHSFPARRAFTLVEILVVLGVLAVLTALAFPVFSRVRDNARRTTCTSNLRQIGIAFQQYTQDASGKYPMSGDGFTTEQPTDPSVAKKECFAATCWGWRKGKGHWVSGPDEFLAETISPFSYREGVTAQPEDGSLYPYVKEARMYYCPSNADGSKKRLSYSMNCALTAIDSRRVVSPGEIVLLVDEEYANDGYFYAVNHDLAKGPNTAKGSTGGASAGGQSTDALTKKHADGGNLLFADGHVKYFRYSDFALDDTPQGLANKWKTSGSPRFHDRSLGKFGSSFPVQDVPIIATDYCNAKDGPGSADGKTNIP